MSPSDSSPGGNYSKGYEKVGGVPTYLLSSAVAPAYGTADSNGYIGVTQDYNKHANAVDRPNSSSVAVAGDELEDPDTSFQVGEHDGPKPVHEDDYAVGDGERDSDAVANREAVEANPPERESTRHLAKKSSGKSLKEQQSASTEKSS